MADFTIHRTKHWGWITAHTPRAKSWLRQNFVSSDCKIGLDYVDEWARDVNTAYDFEVEIK